MITAAIGKIFLDAYNEKYGTNYDAKTFFVEVYHPLFFDSNKYLFWVNNSPFDQMKKAHKAENMSIDERKRLLQDLIAKINDSDSPDASIAPGFPASEEKKYATTSGQVTNMALPITKDDYYYSWFGAALGIGIQGGLSILFSEPKILLDLFDGWKLYRKALNENEKLKDYRLTTWNGQWLAHRYDKGNYVPQYPMAGFNPFETTKDGLSVSIQSWTKVLIGISREFERPKMMGYIYSIGNTNTTIGFIPFNLEHIRKPIQLYAKLFGVEEGKSAERLWGTEMGFRACCQKGAIGIEAMQPKGLRQYMDGTKMPKKAQDENQKITFNTYLIWILSMLNNQDLWSKSMGFAKVLLDYSKSGKSSKTVNSQKVNNILAATSKKTFISALTEIVGESGEREQIIELAEFVNSMPTDNVPYFLTLLRFCYASIS